MVSAKHRRGGFTVIEFVIVVAIIAILASAMVPRLMAARFVANEADAISMLRSIVSAEVNLKALNEVDADHDGIGEYGYFTELSDLGCKILPAPDFDAVVEGSRVIHSGYVFQIYLPSVADGEGAVHGISEDPTGGKSTESFPDPDSAEQYWCAYAWPVNAGTTGRRTFFVNQSDELLATIAYDVAYSGADNAPNFSAAYSARGDMASRIAKGKEGNDGNFWVIVP